MMLGNQCKATEHALGSQASRAVILPLMSLHHREGRMDPQAKSREREKTRGRGSSIQPSLACSGSLPMPHQTDPSQARVKPTARLSATVDSGDNLT